MTEEHITHERAVLLRLQEQGDELADRLLLHDVAEMLRELEWSAKGDLDFIPIPTCPRCHSSQSRGHAPDCELAALLKRLEGV